MVIELPVNGVIFYYPETNDENWGFEASQWARAITEGMLQKQGGLFQLTDDVDFGTNFGLISNYFSSRSANISTSGTLRQSRTDLITWRNQEGNGNNTLGVNVNNELVYNGQLIVGAPLELGGDLDGYTNDATVIGLQDRPLSSAAPATGNVIIWDGSQWEPGDVPISSLEDIASGTFLANITAGAAAPTAHSLTTFAGGGLTYTNVTGILAVGAGTAITVNANDVAVDIATLLAAIDSTSIVINSNTLERAALTGAIAASQNSNATLFAGIRDNGSAENDRTNLNFVNGTNTTATITDDAGNDELEIRFNVDDLPPSALADQAAGTLLANITAGAAPPTAHSLTTLAGGGLTYTNVTGIMAVGAGTHITVNANDVALDTASLLAAIDSTSIVVNSGTLERAAITGAVALSQNSNTSLFSGIRTNGALQTPRQFVNLINTTTIGWTPADDPGNDEWELRANVNTGSITPSLLADQAEGTFLARIIGAGTGAPTAATGNQMGQIFRFGTEANITVSGAAQTITLAETTTLADFGGTGELVGITASPAVTSQTGRILFFKHTAGGGTTTTIKDTATATGAGIRTPGTTDFVIGSGSGGLNLVQGFLYKDPTDGDGRWTLFPRGHSRSEDIDWTGNHSFTSTTFTVATTGNITGTSSTGNVVWTATAGDVSLNSGDDILLTATDSIVGTAVNDISFTAQDNVNIAAAGATGGVYITSAVDNINLTTTTANILLDSASNVLLTADNGVVVTTNNIQRFAIESDGSWNINSTNGTAGQLLTCNGSSSTPTWENPGALAGISIASCTLHAPFVLSKYHNSGTGGAGDEILFNANAPFNFRVIQWGVIVETGIGGSTVTLRTATGGGGSTIGQCDTGTAGLHSSNGMGSSTSLNCIISSGGTLVARFTDIDVRVFVTVTCIRV